MTLLVVIDRAAVKLAKNLFRLVDEPFFVVNKARAYTKVRGTGARGGRGGPEWEALVAAEAAVRLHAQEAVRAFNLRRGSNWPTDRFGYSVDVVLELGDLLVDVKGSSSRAGHTRRDKSSTRLRRIGADKAVQAILDGLQGPVFHDDELVDDVRVRKTVRLPLGELGDRVRVRITAPPDGQVGSTDALEA